MKRCFRLVCIVAFCMLLFTLTASSHSGRTDSNGGHTNSSTGEYHYHHGYSAHQHYDMDGDGDLDCPYTFDDKTDHKHSQSNSSEGEDRITFEIVFKIIGLSLLVLLLSSAFLIPIAYTLLDSLISFLSKKLFKTELKDSTRSTISIVTIVIIVVTIVTIVVLANEF